MAIGAGRRAAFVGLLAGVVLGGSLAAPRPAHAHAELLEASPVDDAVVKSAPRRVSLRFSEAVTLIPGSIQLLDARGREIRIGAPQHANGKPDTATARVPARLRDGTYVVSWRVVSDDSHAVSGALRFSVGAPSAAVAAPERESGDAARAAITIAGGVAYLGLALALGGAAVLGALWPAGRKARRARRLVWTGLAVLGAGTLAELLARGPYATGTALTQALDPGMLGDTVPTRTGVALLARLALALALAGVVAALVRRSGGDRRLLAAAGACGVALALTWTLTDHAHTGLQPWLAVPATSVHLIAMALWLGGLIVLTACVIDPAVRHGPAYADSLEPALPRFSRLAQWCFATLVATGAYLAWRDVGSFGALAGTSFGRLLMAKAGVVLLVLALASRARRFVRGRRERPRADTAAAALRRLRGSVAAEAVLGVAVLSLTAVMTNTAPARTSYAPPVHTTVAVPAAAGAHSRLDGSRVEVRVEPARPGINTADIYLLARDGSLVAAPEISGRLEAGGYSRTVEMAAAEPGHFVASTLSIPRTGRWTLRLDVRTSDFDVTRVRIPFAVH